MITTGCPAASLLATCGSEPIDLEPALRRQAGHAAEDVAGRFRDFLDLVDGLAGDALLLRRPGRIDGNQALAPACPTTASCLPAQPSLQVQPLVGLSSGRSGIGERRLLGALCAAPRPAPATATSRPETTACRRRRGPSELSADEKGSENSLTLDSLNSAAPGRGGPRRARISTARGRGRHEPAWPCRCHGRAEQVEISGVIPVTHDGEPVEQRNVVLLRHHPHIIQVRRRGNHGFGARAVLQIDQDHIGSRLLQRSNSFVDGAAKIVGIDGSHSIDGSGLPDDQGRPFCFHQLNKAGVDFLGGLTRLQFHGQLDRRRGQPLLQRRLQPCRDRRCPARTMMVDERLPTTRTVNGRALLTASATFGSALSVVSR